MRLLIIEDDYIAAAIAKHIIDNSGRDVSVDIANNGEDAKSFFNDVPPEVILIDINMPVMNGFEFLKWYEDQGLQGNSRFYIYTSSDMPADIEYSKQFRDVKGFIVKPLTADNLLELFLSQ